MISKTQERERERLLEELRHWVAKRDMDYVCRSPEVAELIYQLETEHRAYPQLIVNVDAN
jgi:hypothetical protein